MIIPDAAKENTPPHPPKHQLLIFEIKQKLSYNKWGGAKIMEYKYTINQISDRVSISKPSLYALIKKNQAFINDNSVRRQRKIYYNQAVMDFFISYYLPEQASKEEQIPSSPIDTDIAEEQAENPPSEASYTDKPQDREVERLKAEIDALNARIDALNKQLDEKETERKELIRQNGALILTLQQEKQEKMLFLPAPKKTFSDKVKSLFKGKTQE